MQNKNEIKTEYKSRFWLYIGLGLFLFASLGSGIGTFDYNYFWDSMYGIVDWLAACVLYFFYGALIGLVIDIFINKKNKRKTLVQEWFYYVIFFVIFSIVAITLKIKSFALEDIYFYIYFPFHYGVFFPGYAYTLLPNTLLVKLYPLTKLILDLIFLGIFFTWLNLRLKFIKEKKFNKQKRIDKILLISIFTILVAGMVKCAMAIS